MKSSQKLIIEKFDVPLPDPLDKGKLAFVLYNVFSKEECDDLIELSEKGGYEPALVNIGGGMQRLMTDVRNNDRFILDDEVRAQEYFERIKRYLPTNWKGWEVVGLNERLRFLRYDPGQKFEPHMDGCYMRESGDRAGETSFITIQIYLNEGYQGGSTTFLRGSKRFEYVPKTGSVLIFQHRLLHEGSELVKGRKYTIRTDVMYRPPSKSN